VLKYDRMLLSQYYWGDFIKFLGITKKSFFSTLNKYRNKRIWNKKNSTIMRKFI
jgi:hypothetical protein